jgi:hypothetical protein
MFERSLLLSRRTVLWGGSLVFTGIGIAEAQTERHRKIAAWVARIKTTPDVTPMRAGTTLLDFPTREVTRKQASVKRGSVTYLFAVVTPYQEDGIVLGAGSVEAKTGVYHRTGTHLRRIASARGAGGKNERWSGPECEQDFQRQIDFWVALPIP